ncbi:hypothetical protein [Streptomyces erythrochromogenes]|uniref:hypothetical protein n=1 Tax=Streptomyces erythrochromogenes TaxID=285574 RepID=UPI0022545A47|nr:hypothetical protein [Streptomyces erythrochromogenes]MCX5585831.1 hypothetical protein [Streptomyces erythrochromogenes]
MSSLDRTRYRRDLRLRSVAAVWERAGCPPASALRHAEMCLSLADHDNRLRLVAEMWERHRFPPADAVRRAEICLILAAPEPTDPNQNERKKAK